MLILSKKASKWTILTSDISDPERLITILLRCRKHCDVTVM